ncbi:MAG TPA: hypothetical protein VHL53_12030 [Acidimicrobiia bacterium]|nr:hypothetical protein [Acidimicrobiia bacterium]
MPSLGVPGLLVLLTLAFLVPGSRRFGPGHRRPAGRPADRSRPTQLDDAPDDRIGIRLRHIQCQSALPPAPATDAALFPLPWWFVPEVVEADGAGPAGAEVPAPVTAEPLYPLRPSRFTRPLLLRIRTDGAVHPVAVAPLTAATGVRPLRLPQPV